MVEMIKSTFLFIREKLVNSPLIIEGKKGKRKKKRAYYLISS